MIASIFLLIGLVFAGDYNNPDKIDLPTSFGTYLSKEPQKVECVIGGKNDLYMATFLFNSVQYTQLNVTYIQNITDDSNVFMFIEQAGTHICTDLKNGVPVPISTTTEYKFIIGSTVAVTGGMEVYMEYVDGSVVFENVTVHDLPFYKYVTIPEGINATD